MGFTDDFIKTFPAGSVFKNGVTVHKDVTEENQSDAYRELIEGFSRKALDEFEGNGNLTKVETVWGPVLKSTSDEKEQKEKYLINRVMQLANMRYVSRCSSIKTQKRLEWRKEHPSEMYPEDAEKVRLEEERDARVLKRAEVARIKREEKERRKAEAEKKAQAKKEKKQRESEKLKEEKTPDPLPNIGESDDTAEEKEETILQTSQDTSTAVSMEIDQPGTEERPPSPKSSPKKKQPAQPRPDYKDRVPEAVKNAAKAVEKVEKSKEQRRAKHEENRAKSSSGDAEETPDFNDDTAEDMPRETSKSKAAPKNDNLPSRTYGKGPGQLRIRIGKSEFGRGTSVPTLVRYGS